MDILKNFKPRDLKNKQKHVCYALPNDQHAISNLVS